MTRSLTEDLELDDELDAFALEVAGHLGEMGGAIDVATPPIGVVAGRRRHARRTPVLVGIAAAVVLLVGGAAVVGRDRGPAEVAISVGSDPTVAPDPTGASPAVSGWHVGLDPGSGFRLTSAMSACCDRYVDTTNAPRWLVGYYDPNDPFGGPLLVIETNVIQPGEVTAFTHPAPTFSVETGSGTVPAWEWTMPADIHVFGFQGDDQRTVKVSSVGLTREQTLAAVRDLTLDAGGRFQVSTPPGLTAQRVDEPKSEMSIATYSDQPTPSPSDRPTPGPFGREVVVQVSHRTAGPYVLEIDSVFAPPIGPSTNVAPERVLIDGHPALLRQLGDGAAVLYLYQPERQRTLMLTGQGGVGADELKALAAQLQDIDDADWAAAVARCGPEATSSGC